jgi:hypothetical protein
MLFTLSYYAKSVKSYTLEKRNVDWLIVLLNTFGPSELIRMVFLSLSILIHHPPATLMTFALLVFLLAGEVNKIARIVSTASFSNWVQFNPMD